MHRISFKAFLLSTFLLPGLGQLHKGDRVKGGIIILLVNVFLLSALFVVLRSLGPVLLAARSGSVTQTAQMIETVGKSSPGARWLLGGFVLLWAFSAVDAAFTKPPHQGDPTDDAHRGNM